MKKNLKVWFSDFWPGFEPTKFCIYDLLAKNYAVSFDCLQPDLLICSVFGSDWKRFDCKKLCYTGESASISLKRFDYSISFDPSTSRNLYYPLMCIFYKERFPNPKDYESFFDRRDITESEWRRKAAVAFVQSNSRARYRNKFFHRLSADMPVASGGRAFNNVGGPVDDKLQFLADYKFSIAFENLRRPGYATEKIIDAYFGGTIPIYSGDPLAATWLNPAAVIQYNTPRDYPRVLAEIRRGCQDFPWYRAKFRQPLFLNNALPDAWQDAVLENFLIKVVESPRLIADPSRGKNRTL